ncbi:exodeoxyribonuclease V subunit beta [Lacinutrix sp. 5H-3-7-4]|uniref:UvrD-helicase domain-containing protein n=1 Tax=Lacinutrix sp. (strain 5H-3-7-4) TaxID=983544 RepID=UPI00020A3667|nr:UvrD-helicase domain-containing protein [Lacinutrix sp. 5H-3-7-4]AEH00795.1 UvrD/REP helicase [Lacinutrix sp. 5H-3-7-4]
MSYKSSFQVYNASAGSGKTYTLVKEYLKILFSTSSNYQFKNILAITFTNKAVGEMKARILEMLNVFSSTHNLNEPHAMFFDIAQELEMEHKALQKKAEIILQTIMHNYAAFDISTIDGFNHRLIRTFAHDLKLPLNFEVELDTDSILSEAVDRLIAKAGANKALTKVLVDFAIEKADDDKSWDVALDFNKIAKLLIKESDLEFVKSLENKTLEDFKALKFNLKKIIQEVEDNCLAIAEKALNLIETNNIPHNHFNNTDLPNHFIKMKNLKIKDLLFEGRLVKNLEKESYYGGKATKETKQSIDNIIDELKTLFYASKLLPERYLLPKAIYKNLTPLSVLSAINKELLAIKAEESKMLISEFNAIISKEIKGQPTPFIYERMGEKFKHYFIDEFQDTSQMQWENLIPLIDNTLSGENMKAEKGSAMIVGDAKQAIYRWRGGKAEQFMALFNKQNSPFFIDQEVKNLESNFRSLETIVNFNNSFFKHVASMAFINEDYSNLYQQSHQKPSNNTTGFVSLNFIDFDEEEDKDKVYTEHVLNTIISCQEQGYNLKDISILVRKKKHGIAIAEYLNSKGIQITSSETMLINSAPEVRFINNILTLLLNPNNIECKVDILNFIAEKYNIEDKHTYFITNMNLSLEAYFQSFERFNIYVNPNNLIQLGLFDLAETIVRRFNLVNVSNAYIQYYLDVVLEYSQKNISDLSAFLDYFNSKKEKLSIVSPQEQDAIQIMTIHKSKGLEFPVVIFPYAEINIYEDIEPKEWFNLNPEQFNGFNYALLNYSKAFETYGEQGNQIHIKHQGALELDSLNLLYVALTRPVEQLHVIGKRDINKKGDVNLKSYSGLLINYLMSISIWDNEKTTYSFGKAEKPKSEPKQQKIQTLKQEEFISTAKEDHDIKVITNSGYLWDTKQENALEKGNLVHDLMEHIKTESDIDFAVKDFESNGIINSTQAAVLKNTILEIVNHKELLDYFTSNYTIYNERDIISKTGKLYRPDRLVINEKNEVVIIDYKTGLHNPKYQHQLQDYQDILEEMNFKILKKILIYINKEITITSYN